MSSYLYIYIYSHLLASAGNPTPTIQWLKDGIPVVESYHRKIQKNALVLEDISPADQAEYTCRITNNATAIEYEIRLDVTGETAEKFL
jgi:hypothetical protein